jgi:hypothetical protein
LAGLLACLVARGNAFETFLCGTIDDRDITITAWPWFDGCFARNAHDTFGPTVDYTHSLAENK